MPPSSPGSGGKLRRTALLVAPVVVALAAYAFVRLGPFLAAEDLLQKADAIVVLAGTAMRRPMEAADLYAAGYAATIVLTRDTPDRGGRELVARGIPFAEDADRTRDAYLRLGIPADAILVPDRIHTSTAAEAVTLRELAARHRWRRVIVVTSRYHLRRSGFAFRRELEGTGVEVLMRGTRYEDFRPERWWRQRADIREIIPEVPKLIAYLSGLGA